MYIDLALNWLELPLEAGVKFLIFPNSLHVTGWSRKTNHVGVAVIS
jgi:hypothetical protein